MHAVVVSRYCADQENLGDSVGFRIKGLNKEHMPQPGAAMRNRKGVVVGQTMELDARLQVLYIAREMKVIIVQSGRAAW